MAWEEPRLGGQCWGQSCQVCSLLAFTRGRLFPSAPWYSWGVSDVVSSQVLELIQERHNICKQLHLPAQSGSTRVLEAMRRG